MSHNTERDMIEAYATRIQELETEVAEFQSLIDLQHRRSAEASKLWQVAHKEPNVWPDLGKLLEWLMQERAAGLVEIRQLRGDLMAAQELVGELQGNG
jgi:Mg2+ and Co2+ transporter CorA